MAETRASVQGRAAILNESENALLQGKKETEFSSKAFRDAIAAKDAVKAIPLSDDEQAAYKAASRIAARAVAHKTNKPGAKQTSEPVSKAKSALDKKVENIKGREAIAEKKEYEEAVEAEKVHKNRLRSEHCATSFSDFVLCLQTTQVQKHADDREKAQATKKLAAIEKKSAVAAAEAAGAAQVAKESAAAEKVTRL